MFKKPFLNQKEFVAKTKKVEPLMISRAVSKNE
jgi:hypothetical protein